MGIHTSQSALPNPLDDKSFSSNAPVQRSLQFAALNQLISSNLEIIYKGEPFKDDGVVEGFVNDHRPLRTAMLGVMMILYVDPCGCCIPHYGSRALKPEIADGESVLRYILNEKEQEKPLDVVFTSEQIYHEIVQAVQKQSPETHLMVACVKPSSSKASELRMLNIPAIDEKDYLGCAPLNAVIALTVFSELMTGRPMAEEEE